MSKQSFSNKIDNRKQQVLKSILFLSELSEYPNQLPDSFFIDEMFDEIEKTLALTRKRFNHARKAHLKLVMEE